MLSKTFVMRYKKLPYHFKQSQICHICGNILSTLYTDLLDFLIGNLTAGHLLALLAVVVQLASLQLLAVVRNLGIQNLF